WITRGDNMAIFNAFNEMFGWHPHGPDGVEWAIGTFEEIDTLIFDTDFVMMLDHDVGNVLNNDLIPNNKPVVMHLIEDDIYFEVQFHSWTTSAQGGGFSYTRTRKYDAIYISPESGIVSAGSLSDVDLVFDASGMFGGEYDAEIIVASNDPVNPEVVLSAHLSVVGAADIWADPDTADFGEIYVNYAGAGNYGGTLELTLGNDGTDILNISSITVDNTSFTVSQSSASINYNERIMLDVTFVTTDTVTASGTITIVSNDPDQATFTIPVYVNAVEPPVITASPDALSSDLNVGDTLDQVVTVINSGASDLIYEIDLYNQSQQQSRRPVASQVNSRRNPIPFKGNFDVLESETRQKYRKSLQKLNNTVGNGDSERSNHARHSRDASRSWQLLYTDANESVLTIDVGNVYGDINEEELLIKWDSYVGWTNTSGIATMFIYIDADQDPSTGRPMSEMIPWWNIGAEGMIVRYHDNWAKLVHFAYDPLYGEWVGYDVDTLTTNSVDPYGNEVILGVNAIYFDGTLTTYNVDGINFGMIVDNLNETNVDIVPDWPTPRISFDFSPGWLSFDLQTGVIPAGSSQDITAIFNGTGMLGGDYFADIIFSSNDPLNPNYSIPAQMSLTGIPDISVLDETVDFGISYSGYSDQASFALENTGTDVLEIENITTDSENLTVAVTSLEISPLETDSIHLSLVGTDLGDFSANVTITSNDPDQPTLTVPVTSIILVAPNIGTDPEAFDLTVESGETISETLTIANTGGSDLDFDVEVEYTNRDQDGGGHDGLLTNTVLQISIITDDWPSETSWDLYTSSGEYIDGIVQGDLQWTNTETSWDVELQPGDYVFTIYDAYGDGICCLYGLGSYTLHLDGSLIASGGEFGSSESVHFSSGGSEWLSIDPSSGVVAADASIDIMLNVDASSLEADNYNSEIFIISNDPDNGYVTIPLSVTVNGMSSEDDALLPEEFALHQNYPNPFNPVTTLRYDLPENSMVSIKVYDMLGREVRTLVNQVQDAGFKSIIWDATNDYGKSISAGIYLYQIQAGDFIQTEKMVLLK
ncbi:MAG: choice-of-anchor D domain-containing protein, partial [Candidatus Neomarinimicrobiota bacterium]|nr:choice-of-anchor D domain-containing protein [Candidatus Neomarinimicrobiota bacterium]